MDIWAVGVMTYLLLSGAYLFAAPTVQQIHENTLTKEIGFEEPIWKDVSESAKDFISSCLVRDAASRPDIDALRAHRWL